MASSNLQLSSKGISRSLCITCPASTHCEALAECSIKSLQNKTSVKIPRISTCETAGKLQTTKNIIELPQKSPFKPPNTTYETTRHYSDYYGHPASASRTSSVHAQLLMNNRSRDCQKDHCLAKCHWSKRAHEQKTSEITHLVDVRV